MAWYNNFRNNNIKTTLINSYNLVTVDEDFLAVSIEDVLEHLKIDSDSAESNLYLENLIKTTTEYAEHCMRREITPKTFRFYLPYFREGITIKKGNVIAITAFDYTYNNTWSAVDSNDYYLEDTKDYPRILLKPNVTFDYLTDNYNEAFRVQFTCGYATPDDVPKDMKLAILNHIAVLHEQRGDWGSADLSIGQYIQILPSLSAMVYNKYRIRNRVG